MHRRSFLSLAATTTASAALLPGRLLAQTRQQWQNWSGNQTAQPLAMHYPRDVAAIQALLRDSQGTVRCFGGSHSFSAVVPTDDTLISLEGMGGVLGHDAERHTLTVGAGTRLAMASAQAWELGQSFVNEPDINLQSMAGAIATSTHGTGRDLPSLSGLVESLEMVTANGERLTLSEKDGDLFRAATCSIGALGIITAITFKNQPRYRLRETTEVMTLKEGLERLDRDKDKHRNIEIFVFPRGRTAMLKTFDIVEDEEDIFPEDNSNDLLEMVCEVTMRAGWLTPSIQKLLRHFIDNEVKQGPSNKVYANSRTVRFNEMEYTVPADKGIEVLEEVVETINKKDINVMFPIEFRYVGADNSLVSMFSERPGASISIHQYFKQDYKPLFDATEPVVQRAAGRPHWGKLHTMDAAQLAKVYPHFDRFREIRRELDPDGRFLNSHLRQLFGE